MAGLSELVVAIVLFAAAHAAPASRRVRGWLVATLGRGPYLAAYSAASLGLLTWVILAYRQAPYVELWWTPSWWRWVAIAVMLPVVALVVLGLRPPRPDRLGIHAVVRHPAMWGLGIWAALHVVANGDVAAVLMFGSFGILAVPGAVNAEARWRKTMGEEQWGSFKSATSAIPFAAIADGRAAFVVRDLRPIDLVCAVSVYGALLLLHGPVIGVDLTAPG